MKHASSVERSSCGMAYKVLSVPRSKFLETPYQKGSCAPLTAAISAVHRDRHAPKPGLVTTNPDEGLESSPLNPTSSCSPSTVGQILTTASLHISLCNQGGSLQSLGLMDIRMSCVGAELQSMGQEQIFSAWSFCCPNSTRATDSPRISRGRWVKARPPRTVGRVAFRMSSKLSTSIIGPYWARATSHISVAICGVGCMPRCLGVGIG